MSKPITITAEVTLAQFPVPEVVLFVGHHSSDGIPLANLKPETLSALCDNFREGVFKAAGKVDPTKEETPVYSFPDDQPFTVIYRSESSPGEWSRYSEPKPSKEAAFELSDLQRRNKHGSLLFCAVPEELAEIVISRPEKLVSKEDKHHPNQEFMFYTRGRSGKDHWGFWSHDRYLLADIPKKMLSLQEANPDREFIVLPCRPILPFGN